MAIRQMAHMDTFTLANQNLTESCGFHLQTVASLVIGYLNQAKGIIPGLINCSED
jgi:hypothetical protein